MAERPVSRAAVRRGGSGRIADERTLSMEEVTRVQTWARKVLAAGEGRGVRDVRDAVIALVLLGTGARRFECCAFRCGDFKRAGAGPVVFFEQGKGGKQAEVPVTETTFEVVQRWLEWKRRHGEGVGSGDPLFCGRGDGYMSRVTLNLAWDRVLRFAGLKKRRGVGVHATRHAAGMLVLRATNSLAVTSAFLRHSSQAVTEQFYKHVIPSDIREGLGRAGL